MPDLAGFRKQTLVVRFGFLGLLSLMLAVLAAPDLTGRADPPRSAIPLFKPYRAAQGAQDQRIEVPVRVSAMEPSTPVGRSPKLSWN